MVLDQSLSKVEKPVVIIINDLSMTLVFQVEENEESLQTVDILLNHSLIFNKEGVVTERFKGMLHLFLSNQGVHAIVLSKDTEVNGIYRLVCSHY
jgi:hypothetical protein